MEMAELEVEGLALGRVELRFQVTLRRLRIGEWWRRLVIEGRTSL